MSDIGEYQTKESPRRVIWEHHTTISPKKHNCSREEGLSSLPEGKWAVAKSQRRVTQRIWRMTSRQAKEIEMKSINILYDVNSI